MDHAFFPADFIGPKHDRPWTVKRNPEQDNGYVNFETMEISVPPGHITIGTDHIRKHEGGHRVYTDPLTVGGISKVPPGMLGQLIMMLEECRIDATLKALHCEPDGKTPLDVSHRHDDSDFTETLKRIPDMDIKELTLFYLQFWPTRHSAFVQPVWDQIRATMFPMTGIGPYHNPARLLLADLDVAVTALEAQAHNPKESGRIRDHCAEDIFLRYFDEPVSTPKVPLKEAVKKAIAEAIEEAVAGEKARAETGIDGKNPTGTGTKAPGEKAVEPERAVTAVGIHQMQGRMMICDHTRTGRKLRFVRTPNGATDQGTEIAHIERYAVDMAIFKHRRPGGTVLIDCSGSMSWPMELLQRALVDLPSATIATYQGVNHGHAMMIGALKRHATTAVSPAEADKLVAAYIAMHPRETVQDYNGRLCIIAKGGRMAPLTIEEDLNGGNEVDLEALQWLAAQPGPRLWLSDGQVCGGEMEQEFGRPTLMTACQEILKRAQIWRTVDVPAGIRYLKYGRPKAGDIPGLRLVAPPTV